VQQTFCISNNPKNRKFAKSMRCRKIRKMYQISGNMANGNLANWSAKFVKKITAKAYGP